MRVLNHLNDGWDMMIGFPPCTFLSNVGNRWFRKPDQVVHPYYFGCAFKKTTCLWLKGLPFLKATDMLPEPKPYYYTSTRNKPIQWCESLGRSADRAETRSKTLPGVAKAMAEQWAGEIITEKQKVTETNRLYK